MKDSEQEKKKVKIGISSTGQDLESNIDARFGRCPYFLVVEIEDKEIKSVEAVENIAVQQAGGAGVSAAQIVGDKGVEIVITGNVGPRAFDVLIQLGIKIYQAQGKIKDVVNQFIEGKLEEIATSTGPMHMGMK